MSSSNEAGGESMSDPHLAGKRVAILAPEAPSGEQGGAERLYQGALQGFRELGCKADLVSVPGDESTFQQILENYEFCRRLDLSDYDLVVSTKVPTYAVRHPRHVLLLVHTVRVFDDMFATAFPQPLRVQYVQRSEVHRLDFEALQGVPARFAIGHEVASRLYRWRGLGAEVLHPPLELRQFRRGTNGDYFFLPGRLHPWKRVDLVVDAVRRSGLPLRLRIAGTGDAGEDLKRRAGGDPRIEFLGRVGDDELVQLYADCLAVPFVPLREDYGYVTLEAFASGKPVVTCADSGEPARFVRHHETGLLAQPDPESLRRALEWLFTHREKAAEMGEAGLRTVAARSWRDTAARLAGAVVEPGAAVTGRKTRVVVLDMQPIDPPIGGGRLRLLGLYHDLGADIECRYVGTFDWAGEPHRAHALSETLFEIDVPLTDAHHAAASALSAEVGGKCVIDIAFSRQGTLSPEYVETALREIEDADVVVFSHPWVYPLVRDGIRASQVVIYDSQNVEGYLRAQLLDQANRTEAGLLRQVAQDESDLGRRADWILACSHEDLLRFNRIYDFPHVKMRVVPNGVMAFSSAGPIDKQRARLELGVDPASFVAVFLASNYGPNVEAARFITDRLAPCRLGVTFVIAGGVGASITSRRSNVVITGLLDDRQKRAWLAASDIAVNPMLSGSGTNIKMFEFMAWRLPVVTTTVGARGIETGGRMALLTVAPDAEAFAKAIDKLADRATREWMGSEGRLCVEDGYAWERISRQLGAFIEARRRVAGQSRPLFSVVVPTYERHDQLRDLFSCLRQQVERDFEVVVVDQSAARWEGADESFGFPYLYHHTPVKGAVRARNTGAMLAQGEVIAFVDDDCLPRSDWLLNARPYFRDPEVVGIEGLIESDHPDDPNWRPVTNVGFEGIGFMTANLLVRSGAFQSLGGFDLQFDRPHFREDTDLGWRMLDVGKVPYARDVAVFHPAQPRDLDRESLGARDRFFVKDALLYSRHPQRYRELLRRERHHLSNPMFGKYFFEGARRFGVRVELDLVDAIARGAAARSGGLAEDEAGGGDG